ncbi:hypothetical protein L7F22_012296 [Adiantum nelumboides]|nr:hypothetical protein [Adiantum nelumboides]
MASLFWKGLFENLSTELNLSFAYHPQIDGHSQIVNYAILHSLKSCVNENDQEIKGKETTEHFSHLEVSIQLSLDSRPNLRSGLRGIAAGFAVLLRLLERRNSVQNKLIWILISCQYQDLHPPSTIHSSAEYLSFWTVNTSAGQMTLRKSH